MSHEFRMPDIGEGLTEATIVQWFVAVGDEVVIDQILVEIETAKTVVEIPSPSEGTITSIRAREGEIVEVGAVLFVVDGEVSDDPAPVSGSTRAMPVVRKLAQELGVDVESITGSGPQGVITRTDVLDAHSHSEDSGRGVNLVPLSQTRRTIADHMSKSWATIPHVTVQAEFRAEKLLADRTTDGESKLPLEALLGNAIIPLLQQYPEFNAAYVNGSAAYRSHVHLGFAVDTEAGLTVVVVRNADDLDVSDLAAEFVRLADASQDRTLGVEEMTGQTFTISNIGALGGGHGTPIIPLGTSAIISLGRADRKPVIEDDNLAVGLVAPLDLSYDHRLIDGALGQRFLSALLRTLA